MSFPNAPRKNMCSLCSLLRYGSRLPPVTQRTLVSKGYARMRDIYIYIFGTLQQLNWQWKLSIFWKCKTPERVNFHQNGETSDRPKRGTWEAPRIKPYQEWPSEPVLLFFWHIMASHGTISVAFPSLKHFSNIHTHIVYIYIICAGFWKWGIPNTMGFNTKKMDDVGVPPF